MDLRPMSTLRAPTYVPTERLDFHADLVSVPPLDLFYIHEAYESSDDEVDPEDAIESSWHHRALLGDENRPIYDDGLDTDFEHAEELWKMKHAAEDDDDEEQQNTQILGLDFRE